MNMGAGRVVYQDLTRIDKSIRDGDLFASQALTAAMDRVAHGRHALHLIGLVSDGGVHSHQRHLHALVEMAARRKVPQVFVHVITDGRDTSPTGGIRYVAELEDVMRRAGVGRIATVVGPLLRDGSRQALGTDASWPTTPSCARQCAGHVDAHGAVGARRDPVRVRRRRHRRVHQADRHRGRGRRAGRADARRRFDDRLQLPRRSRPADHARARARDDVRRLPAARSPRRSTRRR